MKRSKSFVEVRKLITLNKGSTTLSKFNKLVKLEIENNKLLYKNLGYG